MDHKTKEILLIAYSMGFRNGVATGVLSSKDSFEVLESTDNIQDFYPKMINEFERELKLKDNRFLLDKITSMKINIIKGNDNN